MNSRLREAVEELERRLETNCKKGSASALYDEDEHFVDD